jgi:polyisoprenoid-binding protein YceI
MRSLAAALLFITTAASAETYALDGKKSELVVKTFKEGFAAALAHNHVVQATEFSGELAWDPAAPATTKVSVTVKAGSLVADRFELRKKHGQPNEIKPGDQQKVTEAMLGPDQLDVAKFPAITFVSTELGKNAKGGPVISGKFTLHGVTRDVKVPVKITVTGNSVIGDGRFRIRVSDYEIKPYSSAFGAIKNRDEVEIVLHLVGTRAGAPGASTQTGVRPSLSK